MSNFHYGTTTTGTAYPHNNEYNEYNLALVYSHPMPYNAQIPSPTVSDMIPPISPTGRSVGASSNTYRMPSQTPGACQSLLLAPEGSQAPPNSNRYSTDQFLPVDAGAQRPRRQLASSPRGNVHPYMPASQRRIRPNPQVSDEDEDALEDLPPDATDQQRIEYQRHRNTLAARRSRKRKEVYRQELEQMVDQLTVETEKWKTRAEMLKRIIESQGLGLACPDWTD
ncbi:hypothetical protein V5O48_011746 [Marasmius crinis-equi]|uniref:BZIP domain-containing protein n=1 Tax=Marasmius crinis-equi TaxID=585013 RepID=A0ABR3F544_9AGAR